jgi:predicted small secreted protein
MKQPTRHLALVFTALTAAVTLAACSTAPGTAPATEPTPTDTTTTIDDLLTPTESTPPTHYPSATTSARTAANVALWYGSGGEEQITGVHRLAEEVHSHHDEEMWVIDFTWVFDGVREAQEYPPIPDPKTQAAWSAALKDISEGGGAVYDATRLGTGDSSQSAEEARQVERGWKELAKGIKGLKAVEERLGRTFGLEPLTAP